MLLIYKYVFELASILVLSVSIYYFNKYLKDFFEDRQIPMFWMLFFLGMLFYLAADTVLFIPFVFAGVATNESYVLFYSMLQPVGAAIAAYGMYKVNEDMDNL